MPFQSDSDADDDSSSDETKPEKIQKLHMLSLKVHMGLADNRGPPMTSHHHEEVGASCKQVLGVEGQPVSRLQGPNLHAGVEPNAIGPKILNKDRNLGELHVEIWQALEKLIRCWKTSNLMEFHLEDKVSFRGGVMIGT